MIEIINKLLITRFGESIAWQQNTSQKPRYGENETRFKYSRHFSFISGDLFTITGKLWVCITLCMCMFLAQNSTLEIIFARCFVGCYRGSIPVNLDSFGSHAATDWKIPIWISSRPDWGHQISSIIGTLWIQESLYLAW